MSWFAGQVLSPTQYWGLAVGGILTRANRYGFDRLAVNETRTGSREILQEWWGVDDADSLVRQKQWLLSEGHNKPYLRMLKQSSARQVQDGNEDFSQSRLLELVRSTDAPDEQYGLIGWDMSRLVNVARWGYTAAYIDESTAWEWIGEASQRLERTFKSWDELGKNFCFGYRFWAGGGDVDDGLREACDWMVLAPESPWIRLDWTAQSDEGQKRFAVAARCKKEHSHGGTRQERHRRFARYTPSRRLGSAWLTVPLCGLLLGVILSFAYAYFCVYLPERGIVSAGVSAWYAWCFGAGIGYLGVISKCRSRRFLMAAGVVLAVPFIYSEWAAFSCVYLDNRDTLGPGDSFLSVFVQPALIWSVVVETGEAGWPLRGGGVIQGSVLWCMRIVELIVILIAAGLFPGATMSLRVFCEQCGVWRRTHKSRVRLGVPDDRQLLERIDEGDLARLDGLPAGAADSDLVLEIDQLTCLDDGHAPVVAVQKVTTESGRKKRTKRKMLWWYSFVDAAWLHELVQRAGVSSKE